MEPPQVEADMGVGVDEAAAAALARARAAAAAKGLRPGQRVPARRRRKRTEAPTYTGPAADPRDPVILGEHLDRLLTERGWDADLAGGTVLARWDQIVGADIAAHSTAEGFAEGTLTIRASSTAWATQLRLLTGDLLGTIAESVGADVVSTIVVLAPGAPSWAKGRRVVKGRGPRDTYG
jgi:predicted nucleic acid-binding Zn ribbon protein